MNDDDDDGGSGSDDGERQIKKLQSHAQQHTRYDRVCVSDVTYESI